MYYVKIKGSIGRNNKGKIILFGLKQRDGKVYNGVRKNFNLFLDEVLFRINYSEYNNKIRFLKCWHMSYHVFIKE